MTAYILNLFDLICTLHALSLGATELNPLMRCVPIMIAYKVVAVGGLCWWLSHCTEPLARWGIRGCTAVYGALALWHIMFLFFL